MRKLLLIAVMASVCFAGYAKEEKVELTEEQKAYNDVLKKYNKFVKALTDEKKSILKPFRQVTQFVVVDKAFEGEDIKEKVLGNAFDKIKGQEPQVLFYSTTKDGLKKMSDGVYLAEFEIVVNGKYKGSDNELKESKVKNQVKLYMPSEYNFLGKKVFKKNVVAEVTPINYTTTERAAIVKAAQDSIEEWYNNENNAIKLSGVEGVNIVKCVFDKENIIIEFNPKTGKCTATGNVIEMSKDFVCDNPEDYAAPLIIRYYLTPSFVVEEDGKLTANKQAIEEIAPKTNEQVITEKALAKSVADAYRTAVENNDPEALKQLFTDIELKDGVEVSYIRGKKEDVKARKPQTYIKNVKMDRITLDMGDIQYNGGKYICNFTQKYESKNYSDLTEKVINFDVVDGKCLINNIKVISTQKID